MPITVIADGRIIPNTESSPHNYMFHPGTADKVPFLRCALSIVRSGGQKDEKGYLKSDLWTVKAFNGTAELINRCWGPNKRIVITGEMSMSDEYTNQETGTTYPARPEIIARSVLFGDTPVSANDGSSSGVAATAKQTNARPAAAGVSSKVATQRKVPF